MLLLFLLLACGDADEEEIGDDADDVADDVAVDVADDGDADGGKLGGGLGCLYSFFLRIFKRSSASTEREISCTDSLSMKHKDIYRDVLCLCVCTTRDMSCTEV